MIFLGRVTLSLGEPAPTYETYHGTRQNWNGMRIIKRKDSIGFVWINFSMINTEHSYPDKKLFGFLFHDFCQNIGVLNFWLYNSAGLRHQPVWPQ